MTRWSRPGVRDALLDLQDRLGQNPPLLLWALWLDAHGRDGDVDAAVALTRRWAPAVEPLRAARRAMKAPAPPIDDAGRDALRRRVQTLELEAERLLMTALQDFARDGPAATSVLGRVTRAWTC